MSVSAIISNPRNKFEENLNIPIATEKLFQEEWRPIIEKLDLKWAICFQSGIEIEKQDLKPVTADLNNIKTWIDLNKSDETGIFINKRITDLCTQLEELFNASDGEYLIVYIG